MNKQQKQDANALINDALVSIAAVDYLCGKDDMEIKTDALKAIDILQNMKRKINNPKKQG